MDSQLFALPLDGLDLEALLPVLSMERKARVLACRDPADRLRLAGAGWLLDHALTQADIQDRTFAQNPWGKPYLPGHPEFHFSLSHSGPWAICALADHPIGVDIEAFRITPALARRWFHPSEWQGHEDPRDLCRIWTAKEAFSKALGGKLDLSASTIHLTAATATLAQTISLLPYRLHEYALSDHHLTLCTTAPKPTLVMVRPV